MCGRFTQAFELAALEKRFQLSAPGVELRPRYNLAPGQEAAIIIQAPARRLLPMRWGLVPAWTTDPASGPKLINARAENAATQPAFRAAFRHRRCLVPADGFYEWRPAPKGQAKVPLLFRRADRAPFALAGLWESWRDPEGRELLTFTILTTQANEVVRPTHDRMPVILQPENEALWLEPGPHEAQGLARLLTPYPAPWMEALAVSPAVNSPAQEGPQLIEPVPPAQDLFSA